MNVYDYIDGGFRVFGLYGANKNGSCECGHPQCKAPYKHPRMSNWQHTPLWSAEQIDCMQQSGQFKTGFGVLVHELLVVDVDARNGGVESFKRLCEQMPAVSRAGFVVATGSGGGSKHVYFKLPAPAALCQVLPEYPGIDFKTSGYVVGAGSLHKSGGTYEAEHGHPCDVTEAPTELVALLQRPEHYRTHMDGIALDINDEQLAEMLQHIDPNKMDYEAWVRIGMGLHEATGGAGYDLWVRWSERSAKHDEGTMFRKWESFGRSAVRATVGTIVHYARAGGWSESVTFTPSIDFEIPADFMPRPIVDLLRPPGFVGELCAWINANCLYPLEHLAVAASLVAVSNVCGMRYRDAMDAMNPNLIAFGVAGSGSGKESILKAYNEIIKTAGMTPALYGGFKSEQELYRNLLRHQCALYCVDELGIQLSKIVNASHSGASYLEGLIGAVMSVYSKADSFLQITGDLKDEIKTSLAKELAAVNRLLDQGHDKKAEARLKQLERQMSSIDQGIEAPFLSIIGFTTPARFYDLFDFETSTNGFLSRAMIFNELETNPRRKKDFRPMPMPDSIAFALQSMRTGGAFDNDESTSRIEYNGEKISVPTTPDARELLNQAYEEFWEMAEKHKGQTGLEAIPRRGYEIAAKVSLVLAMPEGLRTAEHVTWAVALARRDIETKLSMAFTNTSDDSSQKLACKIMSVISTDHAESAGVIRNRCRGFDKDAIDAVLAQLVEVGKLVKIESEHPANKKIFVKYKIAG